MTRINNFLNKLFIVTNTSKAYFAYLVFLFVILTILEVLSLSIVYPLAKSLTGNENSIDDTFDKIGILNNFSDIAIICILLMIVFVFKNIFSYLIKVKLAKFSWNKLIHLRENLSKKYIQLPYENFLIKGKIEIITVINHYTRSTTQGLEAFIKLCGELLVFCSIIIYLFYFNFLTTLIVSVTIIVITFCYFFVFGKKIIFHGQENLKGEKELNSSSYALFQGFKEIKILNKEDFFLDKIFYGAFKISEANINNQKINLFPRYFLEIFIVVFGCSFIMSSVALGYTNAEILTSISVYAFAAIRLLPGISQIVVNINEINFSIPPVNKIFSDLEEINSNSTNHDIDLLNVNTSPSSKEFSFLEINKLSFKYKNSQSNILENINLKIHENDFIGIIGASGIGKSSLIDIISGLLKPTNGKINIFDKNQNKINPESLISYLPQEPIILDETLENNIALTGDIKKINKNKVLESLKFAVLDKFVFDLPQKTKTLLGENGVNLSIGQKQRLALARCHYLDRDIMILDEPSSALDEKTQDNIFNNLKFIKGKKTIIIITHNLKTLRDCNKVYEFENKTLIESSTHEKYK